MTYQKKEIVAVLEPFSVQVRINVDNTYLPLILQAYVSSRLEAICMQIQSDPDGKTVALYLTLPAILDEDEEQLIEQTEAIPNLGRCKYDATKDFFLSVFDPLAQTFRVIGHDVSLIIAEIR